MPRTQLFADPARLFVHDLVLKSCQRNSGKVALVDTSCDRRITYAEYAKLVESLAGGLVSAGLAPGEVVAIFLRIHGSLRLHIMRPRWRAASLRS